MTSHLHRKTSSFLAAGGIAGLIAFIVLLWCVFARHRASPPPATTPILGHTDPTQQENAPVKDDKGLLPPSHVLGYVNDLDTELVRLVKVGPTPVKGHDFIYDLQRSAQIFGNISDVPKEHHSGHFRHLHTELWDPHPQYIIDAFGFKLHLSLRHSNPPTQQQTHLHGDTLATASPGDENHGDVFVKERLHPGPVHISHVTHNHTRRVKIDAVGMRERGCFYSGVVLGEDKDSHVAVSLCGGMTGYIRSKEGNFYIEPAEIYLNSSVQTSLLHRIHRVGNTAEKTFDPTEVETCDTNTDQEPDFNANNKIIFDDILSEPHHITKRSTWVSHHYDLPAQSLDTTASYQSKNREYFIEILVVADKTMFDYHKTNETLTHYILTLMSHVSLLYKDATIGNPVSMYVKDIMILPERVFVPRKRGSVGVNSAEMLKNFCAFQNSIGYSHDVALLLTRETICRNTATGQCDTLGLAELGTMCNKKSSCAIIKDKGLPTSYTMAHELGHVLNMPHDDDYEKCSRFNEKESGIKYMMGTMIGNDSKPWLWSNCSRRYLTEYLESKRAGCLLNELKSDLIGDFTDFKQSLPGEDFSGDKQCELIFGTGLKLCTYAYESTPKCKYLWCTLNTEKDGGCQTQHQPWADGTPCGSLSWCHRGACVPRDPVILTPVAGGWGPWQRPGICSRTCGGGVRRVERDCDSPRPRNGGPYCIGASVRYESCNTEPCEENAEEFREQQCARFNGNTMGVPGLNSDVKWVPKYEGILPEEYCLLYCRVAHTNQHYLLAERVTDGTKCGFNSHDLCVAGTCRRGGCDNRLGSTLTLDACGICGGDNSQCEQIEGGYHARPQYGYSKVVRIPKGSSNLDIRQHGYPAMRQPGGVRDGTYLALVDSETGQYIMNGDYVLRAYPTVFMYGGVTLSYTGTDVPIERINSSNSVRLKKDLLVELLSVEKQLPPNITYSYMIARGNSPLYSWQLYEGSWGPCSRACSGVQRVVPLCTAVGSGQVVGEEHCEHLPRDGSGSSRECNTHCRLSWRVKHRFPCSSACGSGLRTIVYQCVRLDNTYHELLDNTGTPQPEGEVLDEGDVPWAQPVDEQHCSDLERPPEVEKCDGSCEEVRWKYDEWSECSRSCGGGIQRRKADCVSSAVGPNLDPSQCSGAPPPVTAQPCNTQRCPTWAVSDWTACNVSCGRGWRLRPYYCHAEGRVLREEACDMATMPQWKEECTAVGRPTCSRWDTGPWEACRDCQPLQHRQVQCRSHSGSVAPSAECSGLLRPNDTRPCPAGPCDDVSNSVLQHEAYEWRSGPWSECSRSCGAGAKSRNVKCQDSVSGALVEPERCDPQQRPIARVVCGTEKCPKWNTGDWSKCTTDCRKYRLVICQETGGSVLSPERCPATERPNNSTPCHCSNSIATIATNSNSHSQPSYKWKIGQWSACSRSCGRGLRHRQVLCVDLARNATLVDQFCQQRKPKSQRPCHKSACTHVWVEGPWTACTRSCGEGMRYRNVTCHRVLPHGRSVAQGPTENTCEARSRPISFEKCYVRSCTNQAEIFQYSWVTGPWKACSHSCGTKGRQIRYIYCQYRGKKVTKKFCPRNLKPQRKQRCNQRKCSPHTFRNCLDVKRGLQSVQDGEYEMSVGPTNAIVVIYCHKMASAIPEEFLSLKDDGRENYAEIYGKQLLDPDSCPKLGRRHDNCPCRNDDSGTAGLTVFYKIKINISSLQIVPDDFTFSRQMSGVRIPFGTAGDCYSRGECPQGRFAINLAGTGLKLNENVEWKSTGVHASFSVIKSSLLSVSGKCGGYCGACAPDSRLGMLLEPGGGT